MIKVKRNGKVTRFDYGGQGMLVGKQLPDGTYERWVWDGMALIARGDEYYVNEPPITGGLPIVSLTAEGVRYHQYDNVGTTAASYTANGKPAATYKATVFGKGELQNSPAARFTGKPYDADLGAYVFPFRNHKPELARWMSADPAGFPDGPNNHSYAPVPTMEVDPLGLKFVGVDKLSKASRDAFAKIRNSAYGQNPESSFTRVDNSKYNVKVVEGTKHSYNPASNVMTINPNSIPLITTHEEGSPPGQSNASLESIIVHETDHAYRDHTLTPEEYQNLRDQTGKMGSNALEDLAMDEANGYRREFGELVRVWYQDLEDYKKYLLEK